jgi:uncharacterized membrane protein
MDVQELQEFHSALEEAKADIVGLWALNFLINKVSHFINYKSIMAIVPSQSPLAQTSYSNSVYAIISTT